MDRISNRIESDETKDKTRSPHFDRRGILKIAGGLTAVSASTLGTGVTAATDSGYGTGGYGSDGYGGADSGTSVAVSTGKASNIQESAAVFTGELTDLGGASSADARFEYRRNGQSSWSTTESQTLTSLGKFSQSVSGLESKTEYEFQASVIASDGDTDTGGTQTFTTSSISTDNPPVINRFGVSEAGKPNPHAEITIVWDVSDPDGDLNNVTLDIMDGDGTTVRSATYSVEGADSTSDVDEFKIKHGESTTYRATITVFDQNGNTVSQRVDVSA